MPVTSQWFQASGWDSSLPRHFKENNVLFFPVVSDYFDIDIFKEKKKRLIYRDLQMTALPQLKFH